MAENHNTDVVDLLTADHQVAKAVLGRFGSVEVKDRDEYFCELVHLLVAHEVAEELVVYPALRDMTPEGGSVAAARIAEQSEAEQLLSQMEALQTSTPEFVAKFEQLRAAVLDHATKEETTAFQILLQAAPPAQRQELGQHYSKAKDSAPTHPHPHAPDTPPGNKLLGPVAALLDRARDAVQRV